MPTGRCKWPTQKEVLNMDIFMTGGTGFVGTYLTKRLISEGHTVTILTQALNI